MPKLICRVGRTPKRYRYQDIRLERKGFLSIFSFRLAATGKRMEMMERGHAVAILPVDRKRRRVFLIEQPRHGKAFVKTGAGAAAVKKIMGNGAEGDDFSASADSVLSLEVPAGMIDGGESAAQAAARELREETGFIVDPKCLRPAKRFFLTIGGCTETISGFFADVDRRTAREAACGDGDETIVVREYGWDEAYRLVAGGRVETATALIMLQLLQISEAPPKRRRPKKRAATGRRG